MRMYLLTIQSVLVAILLLVLPGGANSFRWLGINGSLVDESDHRDLRRYLCSSANPNRLLDRQQKRICKKKVKMMKYVVVAAELAKRECLRLTEYEKWNCQAILQMPKFSRDLRVGTRQAAFLHALSSAAVVFAVTQGCAADETCDCGKQPHHSLLRRYERENPGKVYQYGRCHDNIALGMKFGRDFLDRGEAKHHATKQSRLLVNIHNNVLGRKVVEKSLNVTCRCATFPPCHIEECAYRLTVPFTKIAEEIFERYNQASLATAMKHKSVKGGMVLKVRNDVGSNKKMRKAKEADMIYLTRSRDFCLSGVKKSRGTRGRMCAHRLIPNLTKYYELNPTVPARVNVCAHLCCGRGYVTKKVVLELNYYCRFSYSKMKLLCKRCPVIAERLMCK